MVPNRTTTQKGLLAAVSAIVVMVFLGAPGRATAAPPLTQIFPFDNSYIDTTQCGAPLMVHSTGKVILQTIPGTGKFKFTFIEHETFTNLENGKTATAVLAGPGYQTETGSFVYIGVLRLLTSSGAWVDAGIEEEVFEYDPNTGTVSIVTVEHLGTSNDASAYGAALCAALQ